MMQPYRGNESICVEARNADGSLKFDCEQPPTWMLVTTLDALYARWLFLLPEYRGEATLGPDVLAKELAKRSWVTRRRYW